MALETRIYYLTLKTEKNDLSFLETLKMKSMWIFIIYLTLNLINFRSCLQILVYSLSINKQSKLN